MAETRPSAELSFMPQKSFNWPIVCTAFLVAFFGWGLGFYGPSVFLQTLHAERGWSVSTISSAITLHYLVSAVLVAYLPNIYRRFGLPRVSVVGFFFAAAGVAGWSLVTEPWQLFPVALISAVGWGTMNSAAVNAIVAPWFDKDRPRAISMAFNGASCGGLAFTPLWVALIGHFGFFEAALLVGAGMLMVMLPLAATVLRRDPPGEARAEVHGAGGRTRATLMRDRGFLTISLAFALALFAQVGMVAHFIARLAPEFGPNGAAWTLSLVTLCAVAGRSLLTRFMHDENRRRVAAVNFLMQAAGTALFTFGGGLPTMLAGCVLFGLGFGNLVSLPPLLVQREFSGPEIGRAVALIVAVNQAVFAFSPAALGILRDFAGSYTASFAVATTLQLLAAAIVLLGRPRVRSRA
ncbi:MAG: MFS transporter [Pseudolabrys sp.]|nr:MFS transporter [Pseudolabrys sp.]